MAYSPDADLGANRLWELNFTHGPTGVKIVCTVLNVAGTENQKDAVFQALVDRIAGLNGVTIDSAIKTTAYQSTCTPTP